MCFAFDVLRLNQCCFCHQAAADSEFACVSLCVRIRKDAPYCVCKSLLRWLSVLRDNCGAKSPFFFFQDHYLSFQSQRRAQGRRRRSGVCDCVLHDACEKSSTGDWFQPSYDGQCTGWLSKIDTLTTPPTPIFSFAFFEKATVLKEIHFKVTQCRYLSVRQYVTNLVMLDLLIRSHWFLSSSSGYRLLAKFLYIWLNHIFLCSCTFAGFNFFC